MLLTEWLMIFIVSVALVAASYTLNQQGEYNSPLTPFLTGLFSKKSQQETFQSEVATLYKNWGQAPMAPDFLLSSFIKSWGNGGIRTGNYPSERRQGGLLRTYNIPQYYPPASVKDPDNTLVDQLICQEYSKRSCFDVRGFDRFETCRSGQYDSCMDGRQKLVWETSVL